MDLSKFKWTREPEHFSIKDNKIEIVTKPYTDLWQRTYYHFQNDNAPLFQIETAEKYTSIWEALSPITAFPTGQQLP